MVFQLCLQSVTLSNTLYSLITPLLNSFMMSDHDIDLFLLDFGERRHKDEDHINDITATIITCTC